MHLPRFSRVNGRKHITLILLIFMLSITSSCGTPSTQNTPDIARKFTPSVVMIEVTRSISKEIVINYENNQPEIVDQQRAVSGTGFVTEDGYIMTNAHVIEGASRIQVRAAGGRDLREPEIIGLSPCDDIAVLRLQPDDVRALEVKSAELGDSTKLQVGEDVIAMGYPLGAKVGTNPSVTQGIVSQINAEDANYGLKDLIQTDAAINPGNSGGPLINRQGQIVGINTLSYNAAVAQNISHAININHARDIYSQLKQRAQSGNRHLRWLGMSFRVLHSPRLQDDAPYYRYYGVDNIGIGPHLFVEAVQGSSPASNLNIRPGDLVTLLKDDPITSIAQLCTIMQNAGDGTQVQIQVKRREGDELQTLNGEIVISDASKPGRPLEKDTTQAQTIDDGASSVASNPTSPPKGSDGGATPTPPPATPTSATPQETVQTDFAEAEANQMRAFLGGLDPAYPDLLAEPFNRGAKTEQNWPEAANNQRLRNGRYELTISQPNIFSFEVWPAQVLGSSYVIAMSPQFPTSSPAAYIGIAFDIQTGRREGRFFTISNTGKWEYFGMDGRNLAKKQMPDGALKAISKPDKQQDLQLIVVRLPDKTLLFVNAEPVAIIRNSPFNGGQVGIVGGADDNVPATVAVQFLKIEAKQ